MINNGVVSGLSTVPGGTQHAVLWHDRRIMDISTGGLGGPNSGAFGVNAFGQAMIQAEASTIDPNGENFCAYNTGFQYLPAVWRNGVMTRLPLLGGNNGTVGQINNRGEVAGVAETGTRDPAGCASTVSLTGTGPHVLDFEAVIWGPEPGEIRELRPLPGDTVGEALWINDNGQAVGASGTCAITVLPPLAVGPHAVLWEKDGSAIDLGNLGGGTGNALSVTGNVALSINNRGQVVGASVVPGGKADHAFLWTRRTGMQDLGTLPGDVASGGQSINDRGQVVGLSLDEKGNPRAFLWHNRVMTDLNKLIPPGSPLFLLDALDINSSGEIAGSG